MKPTHMMVLAVLFCACHRNNIPQRNNAALPVADGRGNQQLLGIHSKSELEAAPYNEWFTKNYEAYVVDSTSLPALHTFLQNKRIEIFMGTWCGDSKREVPRMLKMLEYAGVQPSHYKIIMVGDRKAYYKQSPSHEEEGKHIHRVPDLIVYDGKDEINRIVESPVVSLEKDLLAMAGGGYQPHYAAANFCMQYLEKRSAAELMKDSVAIKAKLQPLVHSSNDLNGLGYVLMEHNDLDKARFVFVMNASLFPADANVYDSLGELSVKTGDTIAARKYYLQVLAIEPANANATKMLAQLN